MAVALRSFFYAFLILNLLGEGFCQPCTSRSITVSKSTPTGKVVKGKSEYKVTVRNTCICTQTDVVLSSPGFATVEELDPSVITQNGNTLTLTQPLGGSKSVSFSYAWGNPFQFTVASSGIACS